MIQRLQPMEVQMQVDRERASIWSAVPRVTSQQAGNTVPAVVEMPSRFKDGALEITIEWSADDDSWVARLDHEDCDSIGVGDTQMEALAQLVFAVHALKETWRGIAEDTE